MRTLILSLVTAIVLFAGVAGNYKGTWSGGGSGDIRISLQPGEGGEWKSTVTFTFDGSEVQTKVTSVKVDGNKVKIVYTFDLQGNILESTVTGEVKGRTMEGAYSTKAAADGSAVDEGTWKATAPE
ncbi:MAG: hypothetical protein M3O35_04250 [Acidobacteriota bacterium]|jgi:hypothetical protein|nr:hypothetical protein [Acidobacteriota bacterium]